MFRPCVDVELQYKIVEELEPFDENFDSTTEPFTSMKCLVRWVNLFALSCRCTLFNFSSRESEVAVQLCGLDDLVRSLLTESYTVHGTLHALDIKESILLSDLKSNAPSSIIIELNRLFPQFNYGVVVDHHHLIPLSTVPSDDLFRRLFIYVGEGTPCLLCGPSGSGKSFYLRKVHSYHKEPSSPPLLQLYIDQTTDLKALLGGWQGGKNPGEFVWSDGILTQAVREGRWVVFENIDLISQEIQIKLQELVSGGGVFIPDRNLYVEKHPRFRLFGTICAPPNRRKPPLLSGWRSIELLEMSHKEILEIAVKRFPNLIEIIPQLYEAFHAVVISFTISITSHRNFNGRDFFKLCERVVHSGRIWKSPLVESARLDIVHDFFLVRIF